MKLPSRIFLIAAILLSDIMCAAVGYRYMELRCGMEHCGFSVDPELAFLEAVPYFIGIALCLFFAYRCYKKQPTR